MKVMRVFLGMEISILPFIGKKWRMLIVLILMVKLTLLDTKMELRYIST